MAETFTESLGPEAIAEACRGAARYCRGIKFGPDEPMHAVIAAFCYFAERCCPELTVSPDAPEAFVAWLKRGGNPEDPEIGMPDASPAAGEDHGIAPASDHGTRPSIEVAQPLPSFRGRRMIELALEANGFSRRTNAP